LSKQRYSREFLSAEAVIEEGKYFALEGQLKKAVAAFTVAIEKDQCCWKAYRLRGIANAKMGRYKLALKDFNTTLKNDPYCALCFFERGITKLFSGKLAGAFKDLSKCIHIDHEFAPAYSSRAGIFNRKGLYKKALKDINTALSIKPQNTEYLHNRAVILTTLGHYKEAIEDYERVIKLNPQSGGSYSNLAWLLSTAKDPSFRNCRKAISYAYKALKIDKNESWMDTLATAYAECGNFEKAVEIETKAYKLSAPPNENFRRRIEIYKMGKTYVDWLKERNISTLLAN
jgi:tetratricopeptide (TPR) repeat protein